MPLSTFKVSTDGVDTPQVGIRRAIAAAAAFATVTGLLLGGPGSRPSEAASTWDVTVGPPRMHAPRTIELSADSPTEPMPSWGILCAGRHHAIDLAPDEDAIVTFTGSEPLRYPVWIVGGRNVRVVGLEMSLAVQPGCDAGDLPNTGRDARSIHPRLPGAMAVRLENWGTSFVEGADIDLRGHESDCFVVRNPAALSNAAARVQRHVVIQNTNCRGIEGLGRSSIGDGVHGDLLQNQGNDVLASLVLENVSVRSSMEGLVLHEWDGYAGARSLTIRRFDYAADPRFDDDDGFEQWGAPFAAWAERWTLDQVYIDTSGLSPMGYGFVNDQRWGSASRGEVKAHPGVRSGLPRGGSFAPVTHTGQRYISPHDGLSGTSAAALADLRTDQLVRLYQASFGRSPDREGLAFWVHQADSGRALDAIAGFFVESPEWDRRFGRSAQAEEFVRVMYRNVLDRAPDRAGKAYWLARLDSGELSRSRMLVLFSESPENVRRTGTRPFS